MMKVIKLVSIFVLVVVILFGTFNLASSVGVVPWFQISDTPALQGSPAITYNSTSGQFLVVWEDWRGDVGFGSDVYAQIVNSDSSMAGGNFSITVVNDWQRSPQPAYSPIANQYLVVWEDESNNGKGDIYGRMVNANGTLSLGQFPIAVEDEYQRNPDLAYNSTTNQFLVVWDDDHEGGENVIYGQLVNTNRTLSGANFPLSSSTAQELLPAIDYNSTNNQYLVVWQDDRNPASDADIYGQVVNGNGSLNGANFAISTASADQDYPDIAYAASANRFLVVWEQSNDIYGRLVNADKTLVGTDFRIASSSGSLSDPAVSYNPKSDQFMVVWSDSYGWDDIYAQLVDVDGGMPEPRIDLATQGRGDLISPAITTNTSNHTFMVAWQHQTCHNEFDDCDEADEYDKDIFGAFYEATAHYEINLPILLRDYQPPPLPSPTTPPPTTPPPTTPPPTTPPPTTPPPTTPPPTPDPWVTIMTEDFEGSFPTGLWSVKGLSFGGLGIYHWDKRTCRVYNGSYSGWALGGGADGDSLACGSNYPNNARSWMIYGPFSLADATDAELRFKAWVNTQPFNDPVGDYVCEFASLNGNDFAGDCTWGDSGGWIDQVMDLSNVTDLGDVTGQPNVWIALFFRSDGSVNQPEGAYVDDLILQKCTTGNCAASDMGSTTPDTPRLVTTPAAKIFVQQP